MTFKQVANISEIAEQTENITDPLEIAEELNLHFSTIDERLASEIPASDIEPEIYRHFHLSVDT